MTKAQLWVIAGPNGAGKSTLISQRFQGRLPFVNPDDIARQLAPTDFDNPRIVIQAGRQAVAERRAHLLARRSFAIETTLTGNSSLDLIHQAITSDYKINLVFIGLDDVALSMARRLPGSCRRAQRACQGSPAKVLSQHGEPARGLIARG